MLTHDRVGRVTSAHSTMMTPEQPHSLATLSQSLMPAHGRDASDLPQHTEHGGARLHSIHHPAMHRRDTTVRASTMCAATGGQPA